MHLGGRKREEGEGRVSESRVARGDARRPPGTPPGNPCRKCQPFGGWRPASRRSRLRRAPVCLRTPTRTAWGTPSARTSPAAPWRLTLPLEERPSRRRRSSLWSYSTLWATQKGVVRVRLPWVCSRTPACAEEIQPRRAARAKRCARGGTGVHHGAPIVGSRNLGVSARHRAGSHSRADPRDAVAARRRGRRGEARARAGARERRERADRSRRAKMFFHLKLDKNVLLEPRHFGKNMQEVLREKLRSEVRLASRRVAPSAAPRPPPRLDTDGVEK